MVQRKTPLFERDISWLSFNHRVLQEVKDLSVPLLDRLKFMAIYSSNLEEFFKVRVAQLRNLIRAGRSTRKQLDFEPELLLRSILKLVNSHQKELSNVFNKQLLPDLRTHGIHRSNHFYIVGHFIYICIYSTKKKIKPPTIMRS